MFPILVDATEHDGMFAMIFCNTNASILYVFPPEWTGFTVNFTEACDDKCMVPPPIPLSFASSRRQGRRRWCATRSDMNEQLSQSQAGL